MVKNPPGNADDIRLMGSIPLLVRCSGGGNGNPLQCSCLENPRDGGAWWAAVYGVAQSRTQLKRLSSSSSILLILKSIIYILVWHLESKNWLWELKTKNRTFVTYINIYLLIWSTHCGHKILSHLTQPHSPILRHPSPPPFFFFLKIRKWSPWQVWYLFQVLKLVREPMT